MCKEAIAGAEVSVNCALNGEANGAVIVRVTGNAGPFRVTLSGGPIIRSYTESDIRG